MENWAEIRRRVLADGLSGRAACREYKIHWKTLPKILNHAGPPGPRRTGPQRPPPRAEAALDPRPTPAGRPSGPRGRQAGPKKRRHTAERVSDRLVAEHG